jgi:cysteine desulfurase family protein (TIGR01976 family)
MSRSSDSFEDVLPFVRSSFPALNGNAVYLDNAAGAQVPLVAVERMTEALTTMQVNKGGAYEQSRRVTGAKERVRADVATFVNAAGPDDVAFGPNATTLIELLAQSFGRALRSGDEVVVTELDHHANRDPWRRLAERGVVVREWPATERGTLELEDLEGLLSSRTRVLAMTAASNALGTFTDVPAAVRLAHAAGGRVMVDAVHFAPHRLPDMRAWGVDALVFSPYKVCGPHLGVLALAADLRSELPAPRLSFFEPGGPLEWEPGTQNHEAIHAFGGTLEYLREVGRRVAQLDGGGQARGGQAGGGEGGGGQAAPGEAAHRELLDAAFTAFERHEARLAERLLEGLADAGATTYGLPSAAGRTATVSFNLPGVSPQDVAAGLAGRGIAVASGHYYAYDLMMRRLALAERGGAVRVSAMHYTSTDEIDAFLEGVRELARGAAA